MSDGVLTAAARMAREEGSVALIVLAEIAGSTPREAGAAMAATTTKSVGTIGGGAAEHKALSEARAMLADADGRGARREIEAPLGPALDQCCGGRMRIALVRFDACDAKRLDAAAAIGALALWPGGPEVVERRNRQTFVYGAGHVGAALTRMLVGLPFRVRWIDSRAEPFPAMISGPDDGLVERVATPLPEAAALEAEPGALHVVATHSHAVDLEIVSALLSEGGFGFLGLIGSRTKRAVFLARLAERGLSDAALVRLVCPIGALPLRDKRPSVIAASTLAQLLIEDARLAAEEAER